MTIIFGIRQERKINRTKGMQINFIFLCSLTGGLRSISIRFLKIQFMGCTLRKLIKEG